MKKSKVSIVILNWNGLEDTIECLNSLKKVDYPNYELFVVDNASSGDDVKILKEKFGDYIRLIENDKNYGFAKGNNIAIKKVLDENKSKYVLLLNNDTVVHKNFLKELVGVAEKNKRGAIFGPKMYYYNYQGRRDIIWFGGGKIDFRRYPGYQHLNKFKKDSSNSKIESPVLTDWVSGACMMINRKIMKPFLNEDYYFGYEDIDKCLEVKKRGFLIYYVPKSIIWHKVGVSRKKTSLIKKIKVDIDGIRIIYKTHKLGILLLIYYIPDAINNFIKKRLNYLKNFLLYRQYI